MQKLQLLNHTEEHFLPINLLTFSMKFKAVVLYKTLHSETTKHAFFYDFSFFFVGLSHALCLSKTV